MHFHNYFKRKTITICPLPQLLGGFSGAVLNQLGLTTISKHQVFHFAKTIECLPLDINESITLSAILNLKT